LAKCQHYLFSGSTNSVGVVLTLHMRHLSLWSSYVEALASKKPKNINRHKFDLKRSFKMASNALVVIYGIWSLYIILQT